MIHGHENGNTIVEIPETMTIEAFNQRLVQSAVQPSGQVLFSSKRGDVLLNVEGEPYPDLNRVRIDLDWQLSRERERSHEALMGVPRFEEPDEEGYRLIDYTYRLNDTLAAQMIYRIKPRRNDADTTPPVVRDLLVTSIRLDGDPQALDVAA